MSNKFLALLEKDGAKAVHVVEDIGKVAEDVVKIVATGENIKPEVKAAFEVVFADGQELAAAVAPVIAGDGINLAADAAAGALVVKFVKDFIAQIPVLKDAAAAIEASVK